MSQHTVNARLLDAAIRRAVRLARGQAGFSRRQVEQLEPLLAEILTVVERETSRVRSRGPGVTSRNRARLRQALRRLARRANVAYRELYASIRDELATLASAEAAWQVAAVSRALPRGVELRFTLPGGDMRRLVTSRPVTIGTQTGFVRDFYRRMGSDLARDVEAAVNVGLAEGETGPQIANRLSGVPGASGTFARTRRHLTSVARTAVNHVTNAARELTFRENASSIRGVQFLATLDARTTFFCIAASSEDPEGLGPGVYPIGEGPRPPLHYQCRSSTVPVLRSWSELGLTDPPRSTRAALDGAVPDRITYFDWLRTQPKAVQDFALGKGIARLFRAGRLTDPGQLLTPLGRPVTLGALLEDL